MLETDLEALTNADVQSKIKNALTYAKGMDLKNQLTAKSYRSLTKYCRKYGLPLRAMRLMKPSLVVLTLTITELKRQGLAGAGVDQIFLNKAKAAGKKISGLESEQAQIDVLEGMGKGKENDLILSALKDLKQTVKYTAEIKAAWRTGNLAGLERSIKAIEKSLPEFSESLLTSRNNAWMPKIIALLEIAMSAS